MSDYFSKNLMRCFIALALLLSLGFWVQPAGAVDPLSIVVDSTGDEPDAESGGTCATSLGTCTLRAAIKTANDRQSIHGTLITFNISKSRIVGPTIIHVGSALPTLNVAGTTIQGPNLNDNSDLVLDGNDGAYDGLEIRANNCAVKNLYIQNFGGILYYGIKVYGAPDRGPITGTLITGNRIGDQLLMTPFTDESNGGGIKLVNTGSSVIGGNSAATRNVISGNAGTGIWVDGGGTNVIKGNYIGVNSSGTAALSNTYGINIDDSDGNTIGGSAAGERNIISGNTSNGIMLEGDNNYIIGNYIGTNVSGTAAIPNASNGIRVGLNAGSFGTNTIGGSVTGEGNLISGNGNAGIAVYQSQETAIRGNIIGLDAAQSLAIANLFGITVNNATTTIIGGATAGYGNVISGNTRQGIFVDTDTVNTSIRGNRIGVNTSGTAFPNGMDGIVIFSSSMNTVGGTSSGAGNIIAYNGDNGVEFQFAYGSTFAGNAVFGNSALGIDIRGFSDSGVTPNDADESDNIQNFPVIKKVSFTNSNSVRLQTTVTTLPEEGLDIYYYGNDSCDPSGYGEGQVYLGTVHTTANSSGVASIVAELPLPRPFLYFTSTAYSGTNGSSEFSACRSAGTYLPMIYR